MLHAIVVSNKYNINYNFNSDNNNNNKFSLVSKFQLTYQPSHVITLV